MKTLFLLRHAKAEKAGPTLTDFKRALAESGVVDAKLVSDALVHRKLIPEKIISSDALRACSTAYLFAETFKIKKEDVELKNSLYDCTEHDYFNVISDISDSFSSCMIAGHNDTITGVAEKLIRKTMDNMKTCSVVVITSKVESWKEFGSGSCEMVLYLKPSMIG